MAAETPGRAKDEGNAYTWITTGAPMLQLLIGIAPQTWSAWLLNAEPCIFHESLNCVIEPTTVTVM